jgi:N-acyl-D-amino-acid deacylase
MARSLTRRHYRRQEPANSEGALVACDVLLQGGWVVDGTSAPPFRADVAISGGTISAIGRLGNLETADRVDVTGRYVTPGFVDTHVHADASADDPRVQEACLRQGVTTLLLGQDGLSFAPATARTIEAVARYFGPVNGPCPADLAAGCTVAGLLAHYDRSTALNVGYLAPAGTIRAEVMGYQPGPADPAQRRAMRALVEEALADGALGISTGLEYLPGRNAEVTELAYLCDPVADAGAVYVSHLRGYEADAWRGLGEMFDIARRSGVAVHASHLHGPTNMIVGLLDQARDGGVDATFDSYPYLRGSSILAMVALPAEVQSAGPGDTGSRLRDPGVRRRLARDWFPAIDDVLGRITMSYVGAQQWRWVEGMTLLDAAAKSDLAPGDLVCELVASSGGGAGCVFAQPPTNTLDDVRTHLRHDAQMVGSDGIYLGSRPHPRGWGSFARVLGRHTRELGDLSWGQAVSHLAGHPARRFQLAGRGLLRPGAVADVVVLDPATVADLADYAEPRTHATGVDHVLVGGTFALRDRHVTGARPGRALRRAERMAS